VFSYNVVELRLAGQSRLERPPFSLPRHPKTTMGRCFQAHTHSLILKRLSTDTIVFIQAVLLTVVNSAQAVRRWKCCTLTKTERHLPRFSRVPPVTGTVRVTAPQPPRRSVAPPSKCCADRLLCSGQGASYARARETRSVDRARERRHGPAMAKPTSGAVMAQ